jgi:hypothetical protein
MESKAAAWINQPTSFIALLTDRCDWIGWRALMISWE